MFDGPEIAVTVALPSGAEVAGAGYDGLTAALRVTANVHAPRLCLTDVFNVASGDLTLPGVIE